MIARHLGSGIMLFEDVIDTSSFDAYLERLFIENELATHGVNSNSQINDGGYRIELGKAPELPTRYNNLSQGSEFIKNITATIDDSMYKCLVKYCCSFPVAIECIRWRTSGQIASYSVGQTMGPHSDCGLPYDEDGQVVNTFPLHNTLTGSMVLSDNHGGGAVTFKPWGITVNPKIGSVLIYPSSFIGCHEVEPITSGVRNSYLQWYCQGEPKMQIAKENKLDSLASDVWFSGGCHSNAGNQKHVYVGIIE